MKELALVERLERLRACVGPDIADDVEPDEHVALVVDLLERAREVRAGAVSA